MGFERYMAFRNAFGNHSQVHVIGVPRSVEGRARPEFLAAAERLQLAFTDIPASLKVRGRQECDGGHFPRSHRRHPNANQPSADDVAQMPRLTHTSKTGLAC